MKNWFLFVNFIANDLLKLKWRIYIILIILLLGLNIYLFLFHSNNEFLKYDVIIINIDGNTILSDIANNSVNSDTINQNFLYKFLKLFNHKNNDYFPSYFIRSDNKFSSYSIIFNDCEELKWKNSSIKFMLQFKSSLEKENLEIFKKLLSML